MNFVHRGLLHNIMNPNYFDDDVILCSTSKYVEQVNDFILSLILSE